MAPQPGCMKNSARVMMPALSVQTENVPTALRVSGVHDSPLLAIMVRLRGVLAHREEGFTLQPDLHAGRCVLSAPDDTSEASDVVLFMCAAHLLPSPSETHAHT